MALEYSGNVGTEPPDLIVVPVDGSHQCIPILGQRTDKSVNDSLLAGFPVQYSQMSHLLHQGWLRVSAGVANVKDEWNPAIVEDTLASFDETGKKVLNVPNDGPMFASEPVRMKNWK